MTAKFKPISVFLSGQRLSLSPFLREETEGLGQGFPRRCSEVLGCLALLHFCKENAELRDKVKAIVLPWGSWAWLGLNRSACVLLSALSNRSTVCFD